MYGLDLKDALWSDRPFSVRKLVALVRWLPEDSAVTRAVGSWDQKSEILATIVDMIGAGNHMYLASHVKEGTKIGDPLRFPRPWEDGLVDARTGRVDTREETVDKAAPEGSSYDDVRSFFMGSWQTQGGAKMNFMGEDVDPR